MIIVHSIKQHNTDFVYFLEPIKNNIIQNGQFIRILYSTDIISLNGIYINLDLKFTFIEKYYNKIKCSFDIDNEINKNYVLLIRNMEINLIKKINIKDKIPQFKLYEQIKSGIIKIYDEAYVANDNIILKIAGIWETDTHYGLTYKFYKA